MIKKKRRRIDKGVEKMLKRKMFSYFRGMIISLSNFHLLNFFCFKTLIRQNLQILKKIEFELSLIGLQ